MPDATSNGRNMEVVCFAPLVIYTMCWLVFVFSWVCIIYNIKHRNAVVLAAVGVRRHIPLRAFLENILPVVDGELVDGS